MTKFTCPTCGTEAWAPDALMEVAQMDSKITFYCAYGHPSHFKISKKQYEEERAKASPPWEKKDEELPENVVVFPKGGQ